MRFIVSQQRSRASALAMSLVAFAAILPAAAAIARNAVAQESAGDKLAALNPDQRRLYDSYRMARLSYEAQLDGYWASVNEKRDERKHKRVTGQSYTSRDYILTLPPKYNGPGLPDAIAKIVTEAKPPEPERQLPGVADFLQSARDAYNFVPEASTEVEFKRRYAAEAMAIGLTKDQVVKVYALETGGIGTYDMQAGIHPQKRTGRPISSALGYAQLLHANSVNELVKHGAGFINRLESMARTQLSANPRRAIALRAKAAVVRAMHKDARSVPNEWADHVRFGSTPKGLAIHALNLDADIGPWLQVIKLKGLKVTAVNEAGRTQLSGPEIELMNLAGPRTGLEMLTPVAQTVPTTNFFSRGGYERNSVIRDRNAAELLIELGKRMEFGLLKPGSIEFGQAFDAVARH